jgi:hypothetical protein
MRNKFSSIKIQLSTFAATQTEAAAHFTSID